MSLQVSFPPSASVAHTPKVAGAAQPVKAVTAQPQADTVKLSLSARVHDLRNAGQTAGQIAGSLGVDTETISTYLNAVPEKAVGGPISAPVQPVKR